MADLSAPSRMFVDAALKLLENCVTDICVTQCKGEYCLTMRSNLTMSLETMRSLQSMCHHIRVDGRHLYLCETMTADAENMEKESVNRRHDMATGRVFEINLSSRLDEKTRVAMTAWGCKMILVLNLGDKVRQFDSGTGGCMLIGAVKNLTGSELRELVFLSETFPACHCSFKFSATGVSVSVSM
jgi:hypothetical protein